MSGTYDNTASIPPPTIASTAFSAAPPAPTPAPSIEAMLTDTVMKALSDPAERARIITALEAIGGTSKWARRIKGAALILAGVIVILKGSAYLDGASLAVGGALATAGAAELAGGL